MTPNLSTLATLAVCWAAAAALITAVAADRQCGVNSVAGVAIIVVGLVMLACWFAFSEPDDTPRFPHWYE